MTAIALVVLAAGCAGGTTPTSRPTTSAPATETATPTSTPTPGPVDPNAPAGQCADDALQVSVE